MNLMLSTKVLRDTDKFFSWKKKILTEIGKNKLFLVTFHYGVLVYMNICCLEEIIIIVNYKVSLMNYSDYNYSEL